MPWNKTDDALVFECDGCGDSIEHRRSDLAQVATHQASEFALAWDTLRLAREPWRTFKRIDHPWSYHCPKCGPQAEVEHLDYKRREAERDRLKVRNARD